MQILSLLLIASLPIAQPSHHSPDTFRAGMARITVAAPGETALPVAVWYPTVSMETVWQAGPLDMHATLDAPIAPGRFPLILLSHGSLGSELGHRDWAEHLARNGFVVAAPRHLGDSYDQPNGRGSDVQLVGRPWHIKATLDAILTDPRFREAIIPSRIGMIGFSAGGYTTLVMVGAKPKFALWKQHCSAHPDDREFCDGPSTDLPRITRPGWSLPQETRIKSAVAMAPVGVLFNRDGLAGVTAPVRLYRAEDDHITRNSCNADVVAQGLRKLERVTVPGDHAVFVAPCPPALLKEAPSICRDAANVDRAAIHRQIGAELVEFFNRTLPTAVSGP